MPRRNCDGVCSLITPKKMRNAKSENLFICFSFVVKSLLLIFAFSGPYEKRPKTRCQGKFDREFIGSSLRGFQFNQISQLLYFQRVRRQCCLRQPGQGQVHISAGSFLLPGANSHFIAFIAFKDPCTHPN